MSSIPSVPNNSTANSSLNEAGNAEVVSIDPQSILPPELISEVLSYLPKASKCMCMEVNRTWKWSVEDPHLWYPDLDTIIEGLHPMYVEKMQPDPENPHLIVGKIIQQIRSLDKSLNLGALATRENFFPRILPFGSFPVVKEPFLEFKKNLLAWIDKNTLFNYWDMISQILRKPEEGELLLALIKDYPACSESCYTFALYLALALGNKGCIDEILKRGDGLAILQDNIDNVITAACISGNLDIVQKARGWFSEPLPASVFYTLMEFASEYGYAGFLGELMKPPYEIQPEFINGCIRAASKNGHFQCLEKLLSAESISDNIPVTWSSAVDALALNGHSACLEKVLQLYKPKTFDDISKIRASLYSGLKSSIHEDQLKCFQLLVAYCQEYTIDVPSSEWFIYKGRSATVLNLLGVAYRMSNQLYRQNLLKLLNAEKVLSEDIPKSTEIACTMGFPEGLEIIKKCPKGDLINTQDFIRAANSVTSFFIDEINDGYPRTLEKNREYNRAKCLRILSTYPVAKKLTSKQLETLFCCIDEKFFGEKVSLADSKFIFHSDTVQSKMIAPLRDFQNIHEVTTKVFNNLMFSHAHIGYALSLRELKKFPQAKELSLVSWGRAVLSAAEQGFTDVLKELKTFPYVKKKIQEGWNENEECASNSSDNRGCHWVREVSYKENSDVRLLNPEKRFYDMILAMAKEKAKNKGYLEALEIINSFPEIDGRNHPLEENLELLTLEDEEVKGSLLTPRRERSVDEMQFNPPPVPKRKRRE